MQLKIAIRLKSVQTRAAHLRQCSGMTPRSDLRVDNERLSHHDRPAEPVKRQAVP